MHRTMLVAVLLLGELGSTSAATTGAKEAPSTTGSGKSKVTEQMIPGQVLKRTAAGPHEMTYHVYVPTAFAATKPSPIIIAFSATGAGNGIMNQLKTSAEKAGWLIVGCDKLKNNMEKAGIKEKEAEAMEDEALNDILLSLPHQPNRVYLAGMSGGAERAYQISARRKETFAGILAFGGWLGGPENQGKLKYRRGMAVAMINGNKDKNAGSWIVSDTAALTHRSCHVKTFSFPGGHVIAPPETIDQAIRWLEEDWVKFGSKRK